MAKGNPKPLNQAEYIALAEFRYQIRKHLRFMEERAREVGYSPQQYQLLLALKGLPPGNTPTIGAMAERLQLNHNSMVELVDRCEDRGLLRRSRADEDRRQVALAITAEGDAFLRKLASAGRQELRTIGPILANNIQRLIAPEAQQGSGNQEKSGGKKKTGS